MASANPSLFRSATATHPLLFSSVEVKGLWTSNRAGTIRHSSASSRGRTKVADQRRLGVVNTTRRDDCEGITVASRRRNPRREDRPRRATKGAAATFAGWKSGDHSQANTTLGADWE